MRKLALTAHVTGSIGWLGAVAVFLALAIAGMTSESPLLVRAAYLAMQVTTWFVIVPLALVSLLSGLVASLGTRWGLFRYYWVVLKLLLTSFSIIVLCVHTQPVDVLAGVAATGAVGASHHSAQVLLVTASGVALSVLLMLTVLSIFKPQGMTPYGARKQFEQEGPVSRKGAQGPSCTAP